ncbi:hypothetical protein MMC29_003008 [Sticta canariensis]|nr:hypothetical protein [Sticta canariensis]
MTDTAFVRPADCCDGSDEPPGRCMSTCLEAGAAARAELKAKAAAYAAGAKVRDKYIKQSAKTRADWQAQLKRVSSQASEQQLKVDQAKAAKDAVEAEEKAEREEQERVKKEVEAAKQLEASKLQVAAGEQDTTLTERDAGEQHAEPIETGEPSQAEPAAADAAAPQGGTGSALARSP